MGFIDALALASRGVDAYQQGKEKRRFQDALMEQKAQESALDRQMKQAQIAEAQGRARQMLGGPKPVAKQHLVDKNGKVVFYDPMNPEIPEDFTAPTPATPRDPIADHAAIRNYDLKHPLPTQEKPPRPEIPTDGERKALFFFRRAAPALKVIDQFDKVETLNVLAAKAGMFGNWAQTPEGQLLNQAARQWIQAFIRQDSGAVIGKDEIKEAFDTYLPRPGDSDAVLAQKREARRVVVDGLKELAGRAMPKNERGAGPVGATGPAPAQTGARPAATSDPFGDLIPKKAP